MSRVDENRENERLLEKRLEERRVEGNRQETAKAFNRMVQTVQGNKKEAQSRNAGQNQQRSSASQNLLARRGIAGNQFSQNLLKGGDGRLLAKRNLGDDQAKQRAAIAKELGRVEARLDDSAQNQGRGKGKGKSDDRAANRDAPQEKGRQEAVVATQGYVMPNQSLAGGQSHRAEGAGGMQGPSVRQIIDEIVRAVHRGVDRKGMGVMHIELKDSVLAGATLQINANRSNITLSIHVYDPQVKRLLVAGDTAKDLHQALAQKGLNLQQFEVNKQRVLG